MHPLPPGQYELDHFPRFGLLRFAPRFPRVPLATALGIGGDIAIDSPDVGAALRSQPRVDQVSDFHCVTTWSRRGLQWSGFSFRDFYEHVVVPAAAPAADARLVVLRCQDGYAVGMPLDDLLADSVLLADRLDGQPLSIAHGAPLRLIAPAHYGYKNAKHLRAIEFWRDDRHYRPAAFRFMDHPRARVEAEERGRGVPGWWLRWLYRPLVAPTARRFARALAAHSPRAGSE